MSRAAARLALLGAALAAAVALLALAPAAMAQTYTVSNLGDTGVAGDGSLRGELKAANQNEGADTIDFAAGLTGTITLSGSGLTITGPVDIEGPGPAALTVRQISGGHRVLLIELKAPGPVTIAGLHLSGGSSSGEGGDVDYEREAEPASQLTISNCLVTGGSSEEYGGGITAYGAPFVLRDSVVTENDADGGGGLWVGGDNGASFTIEDSTVSGNESSGDGGGLIGENGGQNRIVESTIAENISGDRGGGAIFSLGNGNTLTLANSTVAANNSDSGGGGVYVDSGSKEPVATFEDSTVAGNHGGDEPGDAGGIEGDGTTPQRLADSIVADNTGASPDLTGSWSASFSLIGDPTGATLTESVPASDLLNTDPLLGPLQNNGGPTETMSPSPKSPVVNKGGGALTSDQRGDPRPVVYLGIPLSTAPGANGADIGAVELASPSAPPPAPIAATSHRVAVRLHCPKSAGHAGCRFALQAVSATPKRVHGKLRKPKPESTVAKVKLAANKTALLTLQPKPKFAAKLAAATKILVREVRTAKGKTTTGYRKLSVVG